MKTLFLLCFSAISVFASHLAAMEQPAKRVHVDTQTVSAAEILRQLIECSRQINELNTVRLPAAMLLRSRLILERAGLRKIIRELAPEITASLFASAIQTLNERISQLNQGTPFDATAHYLLHSIRNEYIAEQKNLAQYRTRAVHLLAINQQLKKMQQDTQDTANKILALQLARHNQQP